MFNARNLIAGGLAVVVVLGAWFGLRTLFSGDAEQPPPPTAAAPEPVADAPPPEEPEEVVEVEEEVEKTAVHPMVLVAKRRIQAGEMLVPDALDWRPWRQPINTEFALVKNSDDSFFDEAEEASIDNVLGAVARAHIEAGEPIFWRDLIGPDAPGFITAVLAAGHRAVTVNVAGAAANAGVIHPGDRVDVILIYSQGQGGQALAALGPVAQVIASNVRVLAIGSTVLRMRPQGRAGLGGDWAPAPDGGTFTLEVPPADAERIILADATGQLDLALRSVLPSADGEGRDGSSRLVDLDDVMRPPATPPGVEAARVRIIRGNGGSSEELVLVPERLSEQIAGS